MWFMFSLLTILAWGGSDLFSKMGSKSDDKSSHWKLVIAVGLVMGVHAAAQIILTGYTYNPINIIRYLPVSSLYILSMIFGYVGLRYIELSVSSPICNSSGAITCVLCLVILGQKASGLQLGAVALVCAGVLGLAIMEKRRAGRERALSGAQDERKYTRSAIAILFPVLYCLIDGAASFTDAIYLEGIMSETDVNLSYEFTFLAVALGALAYVLFIRKERIHIPREKHKLFAAVCETAGQFTYVYAMADRAVLAAPMIASYSMVSVLLSRIILKEKLSRSHYLIIGGILAGILILGIE